MVVKKKTTRPQMKTAEGSISLEEETVTQERKSPVTQVVEVVEDSSPGGADIKQENQDDQASLEEPLVDDQSATSQAVHHSQSVQASASQVPETEEEKRKELVDELFQRKEPKSEVDVAPEISMHRTKRTPSIVLWAIGTIVVCLVVGGSIYLLSGKAGSLPSIGAAPTPTSSPTPQASPTPDTSQLNREDLAIQVLNGGGVAGAAGKMKTLLEEKGYKVGDTGNADSFTYDKTEILVKPSKEAYLKLLEEDLQESYTLGTSAATLEEDASYDARITVGKEEE